MPSRFLFVLLLIVISGCGAADRMFQPTNPASVDLALGRNAAGAKAAQAGPPDATPSPKPTEAADNRAAVDPRKVVYTAKFILMVTNIRDAQDKATRVAQEQGGFMQSLSPDQIVLRVPAGKFYGAIGELTPLGFVAHREIRAQDVSEAYTDLEVRIKNARTLRDRIAELLAKSEDRKVVLELEKELVRATTELEQLEAQVNRLKNQVELATITIDFKTQVTQLPPEVRMRLPIGWLHTLGLNTLMQFDGKSMY